MKFIPTAVATKFGRQLLHIQKQSPQVMFGAGIAAGLASTIMACRATLALSDVLDQAQKSKDMAEAVHNDGQNPEYPEKAYAKDLSVIKVRTVLRVGKLYAPAAGLAAISVSLLTGSHVTLNRRNASLTAAYASVDQAFQNYRLRVRDQFGEDTDRDLRYGTRVDEETIETADGKKKVVKHTRVGDGSPSQYARFFDELCPEWKRNPEYNKIFLQAQQTYFNNMLIARGHVMLNEVYDALGLERSSAGAVVGWLQNDAGDGYVDFGIFDNVANPHVKDFVNGREHSILLDFNVDGVVYDKI